MTNYIVSIIHLLIDLVRPNLVQTRIFQALVNQGRNKCQHLQSVCAMWQLLSRVRTITTAAICSLHVQITTLQAILNRQPEILSLVTAKIAPRASMFVCAQAAPACLSVMHALREHAVYLVPPTCHCPHDMHNKAVHTRPPSCTTV